MKKIGFFGLGIMGGNIAKHLINLNKLNILERKSKKTQIFLNKYKKKINIYNKINLLVENSEIIISCVGNDKDLKDLYFSKNGILKYINKGTIVIDHTTASVEISKRLYRELKKKGAFFFDSPISGGEIGAKNGTLSIMVGGEKKKFNELKYILDCYSSSLIYMGKSGNGQLTKMVNQICVASIIQGLAEGIAFAKKNNLKIDCLLDAIKGGAAQSWQLENRGKTMWNNKFNFGFMNKLMLKDLNLVLDKSLKSNLKLPSTSKIRNYYKKLVRQGYSMEDTSNLIRLLY
ncbi:MAG: NAD(P)-dependent oxidoreductase [Alphaproteobacteria bacterium]|tara:strand:- start:255 stop:1121 length:867 start_codon:yes stop_codon:yes gene_type:complete